jgi:hypothetical protein
MTKNTPRPPKVAWRNFRVGGGHGHKLALAVGRQLYSLNGRSMIGVFPGAAMDDVTELAVCLMLMVVGLGCGIFRRPWYLAMFLFVISMAVSLQYDVSVRGLRLGHDEPGDRLEDSLSPGYSLLQYSLFLSVCTVFPVLAYGLGRWMGRRIIPRQAEMRGSREMLFAIALTLAAVITPIFLMIISMIYS